MATSRPDPSVLCTPRPRPETPGSGPPPRGSGANSRQEGGAVPGAGVGGCTGWRQREVSSPLDTAEDRSDQDPPLLEPGACGPCLQGLRPLLRARCGLFLCWKLLTMAEAFWNL